MTSPTSARLLLLATRRDISNAQQLQRELSRRRLVADLSSYGTGYARAEHWDARTTHVLGFVPRPHTDRDDLQPAEVCQHILSQYPDHRVTLVAHSEVGMPRAAVEHAYQVIWNSGRLSDLLGDVVLAVTGPWPPWLSVRFAPDDVIEPMGIAWWLDNLLVIDSHRDHLVQLSDTGAVSLVLPGLSEPHHVAVDRRQIFVANVGDDNVIAARIVHGQAAEIREVDVGAYDRPGLRRPHCATRAGDLLAIADTENDRVLLGREGRRDSWYAVDSAGSGKPFQFPCGLFLSANYLFVANRDASAIDVFTVAPTTKHVLRFGEDRLVDPVGLVVWRRFLIVADEQRQSLPVFELSGESHNVESASYVGELAIPILGAPFGLAVNRAHRLAVADRGLGCLWTVDLPRAPLRGQTDDSTASGRDNHG